MSNYNSSENIKTHFYKLFDKLYEENKRLKDIVNTLQKEKEEYEKCVYRVNPPNKTYKELEEKLANFESEKQKEISNTLNEKIVPLNREGQELKADIYNLKSRNRELENIIKKQDTIITLAAGYISSTSQFSNDHPINVRKWLMRGME
jgi:predicted  nucleic acid-binding Zn-ribbon protein